MRITRHHCDRCGAEAETDGSGNGIFPHFAKVDDHQFDLCDKCTKAVREFLTIYRQGEVDRLRSQAPND
jgi:hypothetical protein